jgi:hypothetical protein
MLGYAAAILRRLGLMMSQLYEGVGMNAFRFALYRFALYRFALYRFALYRSIALSLYRSIALSLGYEGAAVD